MADSVDAQAARRCHALFSSGSIGPCLEQLEQLQLRAAGSRSTQVKIEHNKLVCQYHAHGGGDAAKLLGQLRAIAPDIDAGVGGVDGEVDDVEASLVLLNYAGAALRLGKNRTACSALLRLFHTIEPLDEVLAIRLCIMLLDCLCRDGPGSWGCGERAERAGQVMVQIEKLVKIVQSKLGGAEGGEEGSGAVQKDMEKYGFSSWEELQCSVATCKARVMLQFCVVAPSTPASAHANVIFTAAKRELKKAVAKAGPDHVTFPVFLQAYAEFVRGNSANSHQMLMSATGGAEDSPHRALLLNNIGCLHVGAGKYGAAAHYFRRAAHEIGQQEADIAAFAGNGPTAAAAAGGARQCGMAREEVLYNLGVQQLVLGHTSSAFACLTSARRLCHSRPRFWIRLAECCIQEHHKRAAAQELHSCGMSPVSTSRRDVGGSGGLGHAVVGVGRLQRVLLPTSLASRLDERYLKGSSGRIGEDDRTGDERGAEREDNQPSLGLNYGRRCLQNALFLMSQDTPPSEMGVGTGLGFSGAAGTGGGGWGGFAAGGTMSAGSGTGEASASGDVEEGVALSDAVEDAGALAADREAAFKDCAAGIKAQGWHLKQAALSKLAYVSLEMEDPVAALGACRQLLANESGLTTQVRYLARTYAAEALCWLGHDNCDEALGMLNPLLEMVQADVAADTLPLPGCGSGSGWRGGRGALPMCEAAGRGESNCARCALHVNIAAVHLMQNRWSAAATSIQAALDLVPTSPSALLLAVYLELSLGKPEAALAIFKTRRCGGM